jgi:hypothetical protein
MIFLLLSNLDFTEERIAEQLPSKQQTATAGETGMTGCCFHTAIL